MRLKNVIAIKKFQPFIYGGNQCTLYLLSGKNSGESTLIYALKTETHQLEDLAGIGSMSKTCMASIRRQLKYTAITASSSILLFCAVMLPLMASVLGGIVYIGFGFICAFMIPLLVVGMAVLKKKLELFPSKSILENILQQDGFILPERIEVPSL
jgi:hypothetical protein